MNTLNKEDANRRTVACLLAATDAMEIKPGHTTDDLYRFLLKHLDYLRLAVAEDTFDILVEATELDYLIEYAKPSIASRSTARGIVAHVVTHMEAKEAFWKKIVPATKPTTDELFKKVLAG